jgi:hypothetical protein
MAEIAAVYANDAKYEDRLPTEEDVVSYEHRGWYKSGKIIPSDLLDEVREAIMAHQLGFRDRRLPGPARISDWRPGDSDVVRNNEFCSLQNDTVRKLVAFPLIGAIAARLARSPEIRLFDDQAVYKPPAGPGSNSAVVGWHTDHSYWSTCTSTRMLTAWVPFEDATLVNGTLQVVDGSHKWPESEEMRGFNDPDLTAIETHLGRKIPDALITPMELRKGEVSFHHMRAIHCSSSNRAPTPRLALAIHVQDAENTYRPFKTASGIRVVLPHDELCRKDTAGNPDYSDPQIFPTLWRPSMSGSQE